MVAIVTATEDGYDYDIAVDTRRIRCPDISMLASRLKELGLPVRVDRDVLTESCIVDVEQMIAEYALVVG